jgi:hypothetical protein
MMNSILGFLTEESTKLTLANFFVKAITSLRCLFALALSLQLVRLVRGFPNRRYWEAGLERLQTRFVPPNMPRYGYVLEAGGNPVGAILLISSLRTD